MSNILYGGYSLDEITDKKMDEYLFPLIKAGQKALVLGIGNGVSTIPIALIGIHITGVDNSDFAIELSNYLFAEADMSDLLTAVRKDAIEFMQNNEEKFDLVIMTDFLMFFKKTDGKELIRQTYDCLSPGGYMWIETVSTSDDLHGAISCLKKIDEDTYLSYSHCMGYKPLCFYHPMEIEKYLKSMGAVIIFRTETENIAEKVVNLVFAQKPA